MTRLPPLLALAAVLACASPGLAQTLTPERVFADPDLNGPRAREVKLSPDGTLVTYLKAKADDQSLLDLWAADAKGGAPFVLVDARAVSSGAKELSEAEKARRERMRIRDRGVVEYAWDQQGKLILAPLDGDLWLADRKGGAPRRLTRTAADEVDSKVSPKGGFVSFVREQNLWVIDLATGRETAVTTDGKDAVTWGLAEFIANEEMGRRTGYWWSPDDRRLAVARVDESGVDLVSRTDIGSETSRTVQQRYPRPGRPNAVVDLYVVDRAGGARVKVDLGPDPDIYLARVDWSKDGRTLYVQRESRDQKRLDLLAVDPATGAGRVLLSETSEHWIELNNDFKPLEDGRFLWSSERSGYRHLYLYAADGALVRQVTSGDWPVARVEGLDEKKGVVLFSASRDTLLESQLWSVSWNRPGVPRRLTTGQGWWTVSVADRGGVFAGTYMDPATPPQTALYAADGRRVRWIEENRLDASHPLAPYRDRFRAPEFGVLKAADGQDLHYALWTPPGFDPAKRYPVVVVVYGGPTSQEVRRRWYPLTDQLLLEEGYIVLRLDNRGSGNRSVAFKTAIDRRLGVVEVEDQLAGVRWLKSRPWVDADRIGVMGWSYGGFMTLSLLTADDSPFKAGIAGAAPTDWRLYDTHYTERFMGTPEDNASGYAAADLALRASKLKGELLLVHGMADDNVIFDNATRMMGALQSASRTFESATYPSETHLVKGKAKLLHQWRTYLDFFRRRLKS